MSDKNESFEDVIVLGEHFRALLGYAHAATFASFEDIPVRFSSSSHYTFDILNHRIEQPLRNLKTSMQTFIPESLQHTAMFFASFSDLTGCEDKIVRKQASKQASKQNYAFIPTSIL